MNDFDAPLPQAGATLAPGQSDAAPRAARLPLGHKIGYGFGQLVEITVTSMLSIFALYYTTQVCGVPGALAGLALGAGLVIDAILDPLIGSLSDNWRSRLGRRIPFMIVGLIPLVLSFNLLFALPSTIGSTGQFLWVLAVSVMLRVSISIYGLPYQALGVDFTDDYTERSSMATWRWGIGIIGTFAVIGLGYGVFLKGPDGLSNRSGYLSLTLTLSTLVIAGAVVAIRTGLLARHLHGDAAPAEQARLYRFLDEVREVFRNRTFRVLFGATVLLQISQGVNQALSMHISIFYWRLTTAQMQAFSMAAVLGLVFAAPIAGPLLKRMEKRTVLTVGLLGMAILYAAPVTLRLLKVLPQKVDSIAVFLTAISFFAFISFGLSTIAFFAALPDAVDEHEHLFGTRREGLFFAGWSFASKAATGMGLLIGGMVLQLLSFPAQTPGHNAAAMAIPEQTLTWLAVAGGPGSGLLAVIATALMALYSIDRAMHARIMADLIARRGN